MGDTWKIIIRQLAKKPAWWWVLNAGILTLFIYVYIYFGFLVFGAVAVSGR